MKTPIESLLRPILEFYLVIIDITVILALLIFHNLFLLSFGTASALCLAISIHALYRFSTGYKIYRYQKGLIKLPFYAITPKNIPTNKNYLFIGCGFSWRQKHTQRLEDLKNSNNEKYLTTSLLYSLVRHYEKTNNNIYKIFHNQKWYNPFKPLPDVGGSPEIHAVGLLEGEKDIYESLKERVGHKLVLGTTRVGKTRLAEIYIAQDIRRGDTVIVFDPKGDKDLMLRTYAEAKRAGRPVYIFHLGYPKISCRYNAIGSFGKITEVAGRISDQLPADGNSAVFRDFAWGFVNIVARALVKAGSKPDFKKISAYINDINPLIKLYRDKVLIVNDPSVAKILKSLKPEKPKGKDPECQAVNLYQSQYNINDSELEGILAVFRYESSYYSKLVASLRPLLDKLTTGEVAELLSPSDDNDKHLIIDWMQVIRQNAVVYIGLDALTDAPVAHAVGAAMFADLTSVAGKIYKHGKNSKLPKAKNYNNKPISIHADEFNELIGDQFIPMVNKAGGAGFQITAYTQSAYDIEAGIGNKSKATVILDNFNTLIMLRVKSEDSANILISKIPEYEVKLLTSMAQATDSAQPGNDIDFTSAVREQITTQKVPAISISNIINLPKGQAFAMIDGGQLYKIRLPMITKENDKNIPTNIADMATDMAKKYNSNFHFIAEKIII